MVDLWKQKTLVCCIYVRIVNLPPKVDKAATARMEVLTKNAISDVFKIDPRSRDLELIDLLTPVAVLVSLKRRVALYSVDQIREIISNSQIEK
jgi:hypothetical protein